GVLDDAGRAWSGCELDPLPEAPWADWFPAAGVVGALGVLAPGYAPLAVGLLPPEARPLESVVGDAPPAPAPPDVSVLGVSGLPGEPASTVPPPGETGVPADNAESPAPPPCDGLAPTLTSAVPKVKD